MLRVSSGQDYLSCNSDLKTPVGLHLNVTAKKCFEFHRIAKYTSMFCTSSPRYKCMIHSNISATIGYLKKVFMLNLNMSSRLDTISLLKLETPVHCQLESDTTLGIDKAKYTSMFCNPSSPRDSRPKQDSKSECSNQLFCLLAVHFSIID